MFDGTGDNVSGKFSAKAEQREVVRLGGAAGEDHLVGVGVEQGGDLVAGVFQGAAGVAAELVGAGRVAVDLGEIQAHRLPDGGQEGRGGVAIEVDGGHGG